MVYLKISEDSKQAKAFLELAKTMPFVEVVENKKKAALLAQIEAGLRDVKEHRDAGKPMKTLKELLGEE